MGVVNVTPDSFSDGGRYFEPGVAIAHARRLIGEGADVIDVGGESTRPGAEPVPEDEECRRVLPVVEAIAGEARISVDTRKAGVARAAVAAGATLINDVTASLSAVAAACGAGWVAMHMQGEPRTMQTEPHYDDVVSEVGDFLVRRAEQARLEGVEEVWIDPGIGFGKTLEHNLTLLARLDELVALGRPLVIGTSRKSFIGRLTGRDVTERVHGTVATCVIALERGASVFRVHDVAAVSDALKVAAATFAAWPTSPRNTTTT
jgi:dihydropteroate synthase